MRSLSQISRLNQKAAIAKEQFLARALNRPKGSPKDVEKGRTIVNDADFVEPNPDAKPGEQS